MNKAKKILKIGGLLFVLPAIMAGICLMSIRPLDAKSGEVGFTAVSILGHVWMPWEQIPSGKVVTVDNDLYQIHTNDPVDEEAVREAAVAATEKIAEERYSVQIAELEKQLDEVNAELETANAALEQRAAEQAAAERRAAQQKAAASRAGTQAAQQAAASSGGAAAGNGQASAPFNATGSADPPAVDIGTLIANGHTYASGKNMGVNSSLTIGNAGYFNPVDITVRSQDSAQSDIYYCIDQIAGMMGTVEQDHPPVYNIVQDGSKIYVLYG